MKDKIKTVQDLQKMLFKIFSLIIIPVVIIVFFLKSEGYQQLLLTFVENNSPQLTL